MDFLSVLIELFSLGVTAVALRTKIDRKSAISLRRGQFDTKFQVQGIAPTNHFHTVSYTSECLITLSMTIFTQRVRFYTEIGRFAFSSPLWGFGNVRYHLRLIGKRV